MLFSQACIVVYVYKLSFFVEKMVFLHQTLAQFKKMLYLCTRIPQWRRRAHENSAFCGNFYNIVLTKLQTKINKKPFAKRGGTRVCFSMAP